MPETFRVVAHLRRDAAPGEVPFDIAVLPHDERRVRRRLLTLQHGDGVLLDFREPTTLGDRDLLRLDSGRLVEIIAAEEPVYEVRGRDAPHLMELCWHIGNRHAKAEIDAAVGRILILRDHVLRDMLIGLGASVREITEPFSPMAGAYAHSHGEPAHALLNR